MTTHATTPIKPGFIVLHGNRSEDLAETLITWLTGNPLRPLEEEVVLTQSSGMAEWLKMELSHQAGICSAIKAELPARYVWRTYRQVLGPAAVPHESPLDKLPMTWRLMQVLPGLLANPVHAPIARYLEPDTTAGGTADTTRLLQLASQLADLFDQYQNHRIDWLEAWAAGRDELISPTGQPAPLAHEQRWQPALWRAVLATLSTDERGATRPALHRRVMARLRSGDDLAGRLPRRLVVFGISHIPPTQLELLAALAPHAQVVLAVPNPCRFYWGDIMEGRELLRSSRRRHKPRHGDVTAPAPNLEDMHLHAHPLLAAWGRQGRDFVRQLDAFDDAAATAQAFPLLKLDLFDDAPEAATTPMLARVQRRIRDLEPISERHDDAPLAPADRSIVFHIAHSPVRELEVLQDQLLALLAQGNLSPRDIVVMVPDVEAIAPAIQAVFGQYPRHDKRYIPFAIADLGAQADSPVIKAVDWLLALPAHRCGLSELVDLLEVPAIAKRFGIEQETLPLLTQWMAGAGIRWGLHAEHRAQLDLGACGDQNTARSGLRRMLLGYAAGTLADSPVDGGWNSIEPYVEVGGLDAELAGAFAHLLQTLEAWWDQCGQPATPQLWSARARTLLDALFKRVDDQDARALAALGDGLTHWVRACDQAGFAEEVPLAALRHGWMDALELPRLNQRFRAGGVTFCTLMPMRAIPFEVVCLLGMNDGDYPRRVPRSDFDLMAQPGMFRPGDRSRQNDDRQLMLEALLSARRQLYVSWTGLSVRDNSEQPPSVLVSQLRDYIESAWGKDALNNRTTTHPLQPFGRLYFEEQSPLLTYAREWRGAHDVVEAGVVESDELVDLTVPLDQKRLASFFRNPVSAFFKERLGVSFWNPDEEPADTEVFNFNNLENHNLIQSQIRHWPAPNRCEHLDSLIAARLDALQRAGELPIEALGENKKDELRGILMAMASAWSAVGKEWPHQGDRVPVHHTDDGVEVRDWVDAIHANDSDERCWVMLEASKVVESKAPDQPRPHKLLRPWIQSLLLAASGHEMHGRVVGQDGVLRIKPMPREEARASLETLLSVWKQGQLAPLPLPLKTALALAKSDDIGGKEYKAETAYEGSDYAEGASMAEVNDMCLARVFPDYETLRAAESPGGQHAAELARQVYGPMLAWAASHVLASGHNHD